MHLAGQYGGFEPIVTDASCEANGCFFVIKGDESSKMISCRSMGRNKSVVFDFIFILFWGFFYQSFLKAIKEHPVDHMW